MEGKKNEMYSRAAKIKKGGWEQIDMGFTYTPEAVEMSATVDMPMEKPVNMIMPPVSEMPAPPMVERLAEPVTQAEIGLAMDVEMRADAVIRTEEPVSCGFCITPAMSYTPSQKWGNPYDPDVGMERGTLFPDLDLPFVGKGACRDE